LFVFGKQYLLDVCTVLKCKILMNRLQVNCVVRLARFHFCSANVANSGTNNLQNVNIVASSDEHCNDSDSLTTIYSKSLREKDYFDVNSMINVKDLFDARVHFGHKIGTLDDRMKTFLFGQRLGICIFDLDKTLFHMRQALNFIAHIAYRGGVILFITNDRMTMHMVEKAARECGEYAHCRQWIPSLLTDSKNKFGFEIRHPDLIIMTKTLTNVFEPHPAIVEAAKLAIPVVAIVDSNCNPNLITYPIPGNDDTPSSVQLYLKLFKAAIMKGKEKKKLDFS
ncbi:28S ribosomal protein S2, mitochondrial, partial [Trichinella britovi]